MSIGCNCSRCIVCIVVAAAGIVVAVAIAISIVAIAVAVAVGVAIAKGRHSGCGGHLVAQLVNVNHVCGLCVHHQVPRIGERILANGAQQFGASWRRLYMCVSVCETCKN